MNVFLLVLLLGRQGELLPEGTPAPPMESFAGHDRLMATFGDRVRLTIIDVDEEPAVVRAFFAHRKPPAGAELLLDRSKVTSRAWRVTGFPTLYVLDRNGVVRSAAAGYVDSDVGHLSTLITRLENERPGDRPRKRMRGARANVAASSAEDARPRHGRRGAALIRAR